MGAEARHHVTDDEIISRLAVEYGWHIPDDLLRMSPPRVKKLSSLFGCQRRRMPEASPERAVQPSRCRHWGRTPD